MGLSFGMDKGAATALTIITAAAATLSNVLMVLSPMWVS
jgi:hypothetical protein